LENDIVVRPAVQRFSAPNRLTAIRCVAKKRWNCNSLIKRSHPISSNADDIMEFIGYRSNRTAQIDGNLNGGEAYCGASDGLIKEILPAKDVVRQLVEG
jgi:hypothetical protein